MKFRLWANTVGYFVYPSHDVHFLTLDGKVWDSNSRMIREDLIPCQFTGLTDKNGKDIYEGDILEIAIPRNYAALSSRTGWITIRAKIEFRAGCFWFSGNGHTDCNWHFYNASDREIIGNIYQNPEILNGKES